MKWIDILNKIAKGKKPPKMIKWAILEKDNQVLIYDEDIMEYRFKNDYKHICIPPNHHLNNDIEIIEK